MKAAALTETLLGYFRGYRNDVFQMEFDFDQAVQELPLNRGQKKKVQDMLVAEVRGLLQNFKEFEQVLAGQLQMLGTLDEAKQEFLNKLDEQIYQEQELMRLIYEKVVRQGKGMINVNQLRAQLSK